MPPAEWHRPGPASPVAIPRRPSPTSSRTSSVSAANDAYAEYARTRQLRPRAHASAFDQLRRAASYGQRRLSAVERAADQVRAAILLYCTLIILSTIISFVVLHALRVALVIINFQLSTLYAYACQSCMRVRAQALVLASLVFFLLRS